MIATIKKGTSLTLLYNYTDLRAAKTLACRLQKNKERIEEKKTISRAETLLNLGTANYQFI